MVCSGQSNTRPTVSNVQAKEAAFQAWTAQGGGLRFKLGEANAGRSPGRYRSGPMKGMTYEEAKQRFENIWASTPESVKEKYRQRAAGGIIPPRNAPPVAPSVTSQTEERLEEITRQQQEAERKRQEMERDIVRQRREIQRQQEEAERMQREIQRQQEEIERKQREIERQQQEAEFDE